MDINSTLDDLMAKKLIIKDDVTIVCCKKPSTFFMMFGAIGGLIGGLIAAAKTKYYLLSVNETEIKLFEIDKYGYYNGTYSKFCKDDIVKLRARSGLGSKSISINLKNGKVNLITSNNYFKTSQADGISKAFELFKTHYNK